MLQGFASSPITALHFTSLAKTPVTSGALATLLLPRLFFLQDPGLQAERFANKSFLVLRGEELRSQRGHCKSSIASACHSYHT